MPAASFGRRCLGVRDCPGSLSCPHLAGDGPRPVRPGSGLACGFWLECPQWLQGQADFACTFARHLPSVLVVLRVTVMLRLEGRIRTLRGPSPDLSVATILAFSGCKTGNELNELRKLNDDAMDPWALLRSWVRSIGLGTAKAK
jgi:hypothetical protein